MVIFAKTNFLASTTLHRQCSCACVKNGVSDVVRVRILKMWWFWRRWNVLISHWGEIISIYVLGFESFDKSDCGMNLLVTFVIMTLSFW